MSINNGTQTDLSMDLIAKYESTIQAQTLMICALQAKVLCMTLDLNCLDGNDYQTKYYTGISHFSTVKIIFEKIEKFLSITELNVLSKSQMFLLTLMKL